MAMWRVTAYTKEREGDWDFKKRSLKKQTESAGCNKREPAGARRKEEMREHACSGVASGKLELVSHCSTTFQYNEQVQGGQALPRPVGVSKI